MIEKFRDGIVFLQLTILGILAVILFIMAMGYIVEGMVDWIHRALIVLGIGIVILLISAVVDYIW